MTAEQLKSLAKSAGVELKKAPFGRWSCDRVDDGRPLAAVEMASEIRILIGGAVGILAHGWLDFKDTAKKHALPWDRCVELRRPDQLPGVSQLILSNNAPTRHDWRVWVPELRKVMRSVDQLAYFILNTAAPDLPVTSLADICCVSDSTARRYVLEHGLPFAGVRHA